MLDSTIIASAVSVMGALGVGSALTVVLNHFLGRRQREREAKRHEYDWLITENTHLRTVLNEQKQEKKEARQEADTWRAKYYEIQELLMEVRQEVAALKTTVRDPVDIGLQRIIIEETT
jgi:hypothetical protein